MADSKLSQSSLSMLLFAGYMLGLSLAFIINPNPVLTLLGFSPTNDVWIRILGALLAIVAYFYVMAVRERIKIFYRWTVYARLPLLPFYGVMVAEGYAPAVLLGFGTFELCCSLWTWWALRRESLQPQQISAP